MKRIRELVIDNFAGGGGASTGIERGLGSSVDIAINHDATALAMHEANHPQAKHYPADVFDIDPVKVCKGRPVGLAWFSPDCKHFSKAKGGKPVEKKIRGLAWVVLRWASKVRPRIIMLENVEEFQDWGPLKRKRVRTALLGDDGFPVLDDDGREVMTTATALVPDPKRKRQTFNQWCDNLRALGYELDYRELRASDYGAPTIRKRLFVIARCDGKPIVWPEPTHGPGLFPFKTAADCIDWSIPCHSIFLTKEQGKAVGVRRPLAEKTLSRIAAGIFRYVINTANPFIVPITHSGGQNRAHPIDEPLRTITTARRGELALVSPYFVQRYGERPGQQPRCNSVNDPLNTVVPTGNHASLVAAFLAQHNTGVIGRKSDAPLSTITSRGTQQQIVTSHLMKLKGTCKDGQPVSEPMPTVQAGGLHTAEVRSFLVKYYSSGSGKTGRSLKVPAPTVTTNDRLGLVTVHGVDYQIVDIGMRMLTPRELYRAQGFPDDYVIDRDADGNKLSKTAQVRMCGNSVCPDVAAAIVRANVDEQMALDLQRRYA